MYIWFRRGIFGIRGPLTKSERDTAVKKKSVVSLRNVHGRVFSCRNVETGRDASRRRFLRKVQRTTGLFPGNCIRDWLTLPSSLFAPRRIPSDPGNFGGLYNCAIAAITRGETRRSGRGPERGEGVTLWRGAIREGGFRDKRKSLRLSDASRAIASHCTAARNRTFVPQ